MAKKIPHERLIAVTRILNPSDFLLVQIIQHLLPREHQQWPQEHTFTQPAANPHRAQTPPLNHPHKDRLELILAVMTEQ